MDRELTREELDELLPLYALDALDGEEREQVARYVDRDDSARAEVESLREAASFLPRSDVRAPASDVHIPLSAALYRLRVVEADGGGTINQAKFLPDQWNEFGCPLDRGHDPRRQDHTLEPALPTLHRHLSAGRVRGP